MKVGIIIVIYNGKKYLPRLFGSLFNYDSEMEREIIVVDNCSTDGSIEWITERYPVKALKQDKNLGFAAGNNVGIEYAVKSGCDYVMLLNQDTIVTDNYLEKLIKRINTSAKIAAVQPAIYLYPHIYLINSIGNVINYLGFGYTYGHKTRDISPRFSDLEINYCSGAACLIKCSVLKEIGLFDQDYFMYHEDLDLGWRISLAGYKNIIEPSAVVYHQYEFSRSISKYYYMERNRFLTIIKNYKLATLLIIMPALIAMELGLLIFSFFNGWWLEKIKVYYYFLNPVNWRLITKKRRLIQKNRICGDKEVIKYFSGVIEHQEAKSLVLKLVNPLTNIYWQIVKFIVIW